MAGEDSMFREHAVESVSAPESINVVAPIAPPRLWLVFVGIALMLAAFVGWGFLGSIPLTVRGTGSQSRGDAMGATLLTWSGLAADSTADSRNWRSSPAMASTAASYANPAGNAYERAFHPYAS